ncbi:MAG TPA: 4'-phosphopantetheinyl transferase superfamily protein [Xanthomonadales bacterium]|nr:4'-phosphopantetheinyl transferase superfamily protein [Xanthomonadales bacterium]
MSASAGNRHRCFELERVFGSDAPVAVHFASQGIDDPQLEALAAQAGVEPLGAEFPLPRRREFLAGRLAAHAALAALGERGVVGRLQRAPVWPQGCSGSISHANGWAVAVAASARHWQALGIDLEAPIQPELVPTLRRAFADEEWQQCCEVADPLLWARAWAAKEAAWKCASALGPAPRLHELVVAWESAERGSLALRVPQRGDTVVMQLHAACWSGQALVLAALAV